MKTWSYLQEHFDGKNAGEHVVKVSQDNVPLTLLLNGIFSGQGNTAEDDDDHNEGIEARDCHNAMDKNPHTVDVDKQLD